MEHRVLENSKESDIAGTQSEWKYKRGPWRWAGPGPEGSCRPLSRVGSPTVSPPRQGEWTRDSHTSLLGLPLRSGVLFLTPWIWAELRDLLTNRRQQKWHSWTSETKSQEALWLLPRSLGEPSQGAPWTLTLLCWQDHSSLSWLSLAFQQSLKSLPEPSRWTKLSRTLWIFPIFHWIPMSNLNRHQMEQRTGPLEPCPNSWPRKLWEKRKRLSCLLLFWGSYYA